MSDIEKEVFRQKAIDLINEYRQQDGLSPIHFLPITTPKVRAFIRSIQLHEKTKEELADCKQELADFRQEVSDAVEKAQTVREIHCQCSRKHLVSFDILNQFIIPAPKPDPLVVACNALNWDFSVAEELRTILDALGFEIRGKNDGN